jgi:azurin
LSNIALRHRPAFQAARLSSAFVVTLVILLATTLLSAQAPQVVRIGTLPGLRYDTATFFVRPGASVELLFSNYDEMLHNLVITRPGARERIIQAALEMGAGAADRDFVPSSPEVLWSTKLISTGQSVTLRFTAPSTAGDYPFVCTMPGHGILMFGTMTVTNTPRPPVMNPVEPTSESRDHGVHERSSRVVSGFMPDAGPASIAVELPGGVSYVWDAGAGRFRYAWAGPIPTLPSSPERGLAKLSGPIFYREPSFPLRIGASPDSPPKSVQFKGYAIDALGVPEFEIVVDGTTVRERAEVRDGQFVRRFRVAGTGTVWFMAPEGAAINVTGGVRQGGFHRLSGPAAEEFTVTHALPAAIQPAGTDR